MISIGMCRGTEDGDREINLLSWFVSMVEGLIEREAFSNGILHVQN